MPPWRKLGSGNYNLAYVNEDYTKVLKIQHDASEQTDRPKRSVRVWNEINAHWPPPASLLSSKHGNGWVCPYVSGRQSTDSEMSNALIDIYSRTGRIVVDATARENFLTTDDEQVVCIDIGMALQMEKQDEPVLALTGTRGRSGSITSINAWSELQSVYEPFLKTCGRTNPQTVNTVKALLFIKSNRPDIVNVDFLKSDDELVKRLSWAYDTQCSETKDSYDEQEINLAKKDLLNEKPISLEHLKESCRTELVR